MRVGCGASCLLALNERRGEQLAPLSSMWGELFASPYLWPRPIRKEARGEQLAAPFTHMHLLTDLFRMLIGEINHLTDVVLKVGRAS
jgi:hypothetical protein